MKYFTDGEIIEILKRQDRQSTNEIVAYLYEEYKKLITQMVRQLGGSHKDGEDVFQDLILAFLNNVWKKDFELHDDTKLSTYLYEVGRNIWLKKVRKETSGKERNNKYLLERESTRPEDPNALDEIIDSENTQLSLTIFGQLPSEARDLLKAFYYDHMNYKEIAELLRFPSHNAAKTAKMRALQKLIGIMNKFKF